MRYRYDDTFVIGAIDSATIETIEDRAIFEVLHKLKVSDEFLVERLVVAKVYMELCKMQMESDGMEQKYRLYKDEFTFYYNLAKNRSNDFGSVEVVRG